MALELDTRQRAMLREMGVQVWLPEHGVALLEKPAEGSAAAPHRAVAVPRPVAPTPPSVRAGTPPVRPVAPTPASAGLSSGVAGTAPGRVASAAALDWNALAEAVGQCQACALCAGRSHSTLVPPAEQTCDWMVVGDPPDEDEDRAGAPFAGQDGVLLDNMLRAVGQPSAYRSNVLKCRPAHGALPQAAELAQCSAYLQREIALVQPKVILSMGRFANQLLLGETPEQAALPLGKLRGTVYRYQGIAVVVSYPPKLLMRNSADKAKAWADLCLAAATVASAGG